MRFLLITIFLVFVCFCKAQKWTDIGFNLGISSYNGDLNETRLFYNPAFSKGLLFKHNINERYAAKLAVTNANLRSSDLEYEKTVQNIPRNPFKTKVWDVVLQAEFNFLPYNQLELGTNPISPYVAAGIGGARFESAGNIFNIFSIPFGIGMKYKITTRIGISSEWTFRKTFNDAIDNTENLIIEGTKSKIHNNDWYSFLHFMVTYNISKLRIECPAYEY